ncbi:MAG TPA: translesion DNA synthesis-associated protein ImuA [Gammaproteobacteria bacterium]|nr:translesion DNA synthesis-associated protein ImuA [Gammaproteobacteria bacterium]
MSLEDLMRRACLWRAGEACAEPGLPTGFEALDAALPGGGWPFPGLVEILSAQPGSGGLRLLLPALARLSRESRWLIWVAPPYQPYAPALRAADLALQRVMLVDLASETQDADGSVRPTAAASAEVLWAFEQALRFPGCGAALLWPREIDALCLRRLQLACEAGGTLGVLFRPAECAAQASPAALRLLLKPQPARAALDVILLKCRGSPRARECHLPLEDEAAGASFGMPSG